MKIMARTRIVGTGQQLADALTDILSEFVDEEEETINRIFRSVANETMVKVKAKAPRD